MANSKSIKKLELAIEQTEFSHKGIFTASKDEEGVIFLAFTIETADLPEGFDPDYYNPTADKIAEASGFDIVDSIVDTYIDRYGDELYSETATLIAKKKRLLSHRR